MKGNTVRSESDFITNLPNNIIDNILGCLPLRDVVRTSILSREWRYKWTSCPDIVFDFWFDQMFLGGHKLEPLIYQILKQHKGPLLKFALQVPDLKSNPDIDQWVRLLPNNTLQDLTLHVSRGETHNLTSHLFTFQHFRNLKLYNCVFDPIPGFKGFNKLVNLELQRVALVPETFGKFIASCPAIERLKLIHCTSFDCLEINGPKLKYFEFHGVFRSVLFENCPVLRDVKLTFSSMEFKSGNRFSLDLVKALSCLPALEDLQLQAYALEAFTFDVVDSVADFLRSQRSSESLTQLKTVKMQLFSGIEAEMEFVKYLLASATALEEMTITPHAGSVTDGGESILNELKLYPRASPSAEIFSSDKNYGKKHI
ncbi:hypothetical protein DH2020_029065 [Rehmannia glutinosa]|uniref:F-box domain-containing protein n=1 Tax=Rehmannia glutinosa TaxID=99300 RepID=A0ABR0VRD6_REHGL